MRSARFRVLSVASCACAVAAMSRSMTRRSGLTAGIDHRGGESATAHRRGDVLEPHTERSEIYDRLGREPRGLEPLTPCLQSSENRLTIRLLSVNWQVRRGQFWP